MSKTTTTTTARSYTSRNPSLAPTSRRRIASAEAYLSHIDERMKKRKIPMNFFQDPEDMYIEIQDLKSKLAKAQTECTRLRTLLQKTEYGKSRKQKQVEELLRANAIVETTGPRYETLFKEVNVS